ncbi:hypothetical protein [Pseudomonas nicosulfuronedens]
MLSITPAFFAVFAIGLLELLLSACWSKTYWHTGFPLLRIKKPIRTGKPPLDLKNLSQRLLDDGYSALVFHQFKTDYIGFRESMRPIIGGFNYTPLLRGTLEITADNQVQVIGKLNWFPLSFSSLFIWLSFVLPSQKSEFLWGSMLLPLCLAGMLIFIFRIQRKRFSRLAELVAN